MKTLIITAHPSSKGKTHSIAESYKKSAERRGYQVEILNLYKSDYKLPFYTFENLRETPADINVKPIQDMITAADELVFIHPIWWGLMPAILKNFLDHVFAAHFAFKYNEHGKVIGLLKGKTARIFLTAGAPRPIAWLLYESPISPIKTIWKYFVLEYSGIRMSSYMILPGCNAKGYCNQYLEDFLRKTEQI